MIKVFVSTMYSGEGEFQDCISSIQKQKHVQIEHHIIYRQNEFEAHKNQIKTWQIIQDRFDVFIKVDADTVITNELAFASVYEEMIHNRASAAQIRLHDFFTDSLISGLNFYTKESIFSEPDNKIFCDRSVIHKKLLHSDNGYFKNFTPIGLHAFNPTPIQAFHYGVHRGIKNRTSEYFLVKAAHEKFYTSERYLALKGFEKSSLFKTNNEFNYTDEFFNKIFQETLIEINQCQKS